MILSHYCRHRYIFVKGQQRTVFISDGSNTSFLMSLVCSQEVWTVVSRPFHTEFLTVLTSMIGMLPI